MKRIKFLLVPIIILFISCAKYPIAIDQKGEFKVELLFEKNGCKVYRFLDAGRYVYWSDCSGKVQYNYTKSTGKSNTPCRVESINN